MGLLGIGLPLGMAIGIAVGSGMDKKAQEKDNNVHAFPVTESWLDIGRIEDFEKAENLVEQLHYKNRNLI